MDNKTTVTVRWWDGYLETFDCIESRFGSDLLWMRLSSGQNRHIPTRHIRWYSIIPESHEGISKEIINTVNISTIDAKGIANFLNSLEGKTTVVNIIQESIRNNGILRKRGLKVK
jgi:hypothetical protein